MKNLESIQKEIEIMRQRMTDVAEKNGLQHELTIEVSMELDRLLNKYERLKRCKD